jgi:hypothetical protein|tara:strand:- start:49 stop:249 length:201 start_codon:yes stop_codon:yes gene_type:complete
MSIANIVTRGFVIGPLTKLVTMGYDISTFIPPVIPVSNGLVGNQSTGNGIVSNQTAGSSLTGRGRL